jgi:hypothetical protein
MKTANDFLDPVAVNLARQNHALAVDVPELTVQDKGLQDDQSLATPPPS